MDAITFPYTAVQLTAQVNRIPNMYGLINVLNVFPSAGSISTIIEVRREEYTLAVLPARERGAPASTADRKRGDALFFEVPHFPHDDTIGPRDLQNLLAQVGNALVPRTFEEEMAKRLVQIRNKHAITREWLRMSALKGLITDGSGATIYNLFDAFDFTKVVLYFDLSNANADISGTCARLFEQIATNLRGETMTHVRVIVSSDFFGKFVEHPKVQKFWLNWQNAAQLANISRTANGGQFGRSFVFQNIEFVEYYGMAPVKENGALVSKPFVSAGKGHAYPVGTLSSFETYDAPPEDIRFVNEPGQEIFISPKILDHGAGVELHTQSNPLPICKRPEVLVEVDAAADPD
ncbi:major capsid protein [Xanthobacter sediminis]